MGWMVGRTLPPFVVVDVVVVVAVVVVFFFGGSDAGCGTPDTITITPCRFILPSSPRLR